MAERKIHTQEFKIEVVRLVQECGNIAQTAKELGISDISDNTL